MQYKILEYIKRLIYPPTCGFCGKLDEKFLCKKCELKLSVIHRSEIKSKEEVKKMQGILNIYFDELTYLFKYEGLIRKRLIAYKFHECSYLYKSIVKYLLKDKKILENIKKYDTIVPVPISKKRNKKRGYNQSLLIAKQVAKYLGIELNENILIKTKNIAPQSTLNKEERAKNIKDAYEITNTIDTSITGKKVLIIDDIFTTGNTVNEISKVLSKCKPRKIGILVIAKD